MMNSPCSFAFALSFLLLAFIKNFAWDFFDRSRPIIRNVIIAFHTFICCKHVRSGIHNIGQRPLVLTILAHKFAIQRISDSVILSLKSGLKVVIQEFTLPVIDERLQFVLHGRHFVILVTQSCSWVHWLISLMMLRSSSSILSPSKHHHGIHLPRCFLLFQSTTQILHRDRLDLVFAKSETFSEDLVLNLVVLLTFVAILRSSSLHLLLGEDTVMLLIFFIRTELIDSFAHLLNFYLLLLFLSNLDAFLSVVIKSLSFP